MTPEAFAREWQILAELLPADWKEQARKQRAIRAAKGVSDPETLLRLLLMHVATGLSLKSTVARAEAQKLARLSHVALSKRLGTAGPWLEKLGQEMFEQTGFRRQRKPATDRRVRAVDATTVEEPGATGTDWRVHYSLTLPELKCDFYSVTPPSGGETFNRIPVMRGDIILGDRGYCHRGAVAHVVRRGGDVIVRMNTTTFPLLDLQGRRFELLPHLRTLDGFKPHSWPVRFVWKGKKYRGRLCAVRKTETAAVRAQKRAKRDADRRGKNLRPETLEAANYIFVFTTVLRRELALRDVLELYRARWQVELVFKRLKSLLRLGHLAKRTDASSRAWLQAKLLTALLIERLAEKARLFSPWGHNGAAP